MRLPRRVMAGGLAFFLTCAPPVCLRPHPPSHICSLRLPSIPHPFRAPLTAAARGYNAAFSNGCRGQSHSGCQRGRVSSLAPHPSFGISVRGTAVITQHSPVGARRCRGAGRRSSRTRHWSLRDCSASVNKPHSDTNAHIQEPALTYHAPPAHTRHIATITHTHLLCCPLPVCVCVGLRCRGHAQLSASHHCICLLSQRLFWFCAHEQLSAVIQHDCHEFCGSGRRLVAKNSPALFPSVVAARNVYLRDSFLTVGLRLRCRPRTSVTINPATAVPQLKSTAQVRQTRTLVEFLETIGENIDPVAQPRPPRPPPTMATSQTRLKLGDYILDTSQSLGSGSFAEVFLGEDPKGNLVAIKRIHKSKLTKPANKRLLEQEIAISRVLDHPNIVKLYGIIEYGDYTCLIMEYCNEGDLNSFISKARKIDEPTISFILKSIAEGLAYLHSRGIIHRDLKPQNILLHRTSKNSLVFKLADFGFARYLEQDMAATFCGSPLYMAPEVLNGEPYDGAADLWSVGVIAYQCLTNKTPYRASNIAALQTLLRTTKKELFIPETCSQALADLLRSLLSMSAARRLPLEGLLRHPFVAGRDTGSAPAIAPSAPIPIPATTPAVTAAAPVSSSRGLPNTFSPTSPLSTSPSPAVDRIGLAPSALAAGSPRSLNSLERMTPASDESLSLERSYVILETENVAFNAALEDAQSKAEKRVARLGSVDARDVQSFLSLLNALVVAPNAVLAAARELLKLSASLSSSVIRESTSSSPGWSSLSQISIVQRSEALMLLGKAMTLFHRGASQIRYALDRGQYSVLSSSEALENVRQYQRKYNDCVNQVDRLRIEIGQELAGMSPAQRPSSVASVEELLFDYARRLCTEGATFEAIYNFQTSEALYARALCIFDIIEADLRGEEKAALKQFASLAQQRLQIVSQQSRNKSSSKETSVLASVVLPQLSSSELKSPPVSPTQRAAPTQASPPGSVEGVSSPVAVPGSSRPKTGSVASASSPSSVGSTRLGAEKYAVCSCGTAYAENAKFCSICGSARK
eukprot:m.907314 g.907314  ORF g.907314 m.907314 type:complete len:1034 (+) comp60090_c1_seq2:1607-4708(+)